MHCMYAMRPKTYSQVSSPCTMSGWEIGFAYSYSFVTCIRLFLQCKITINKNNIENFTWATIQYSNITIAAALDSKTQQQHAERYIARTQSNITPELFLASSAEAVLSAFTILGAHCAHEWRRSDRWVTGRFDRCNAVVGLTQLSKLCNVQRSGHTDTHRSSTSDSQITSWLSSTLHTPSSDWLKLLVSSLASSHCIFSSPIHTCTHHSSRWKCRIIFFVCRFITLLVLHSLALSLLA